MDGYGYTCDELEVYAYDCAGCVNCDEDYSAAPPADECPVVYTVPGAGSELTCDDLVDGYGYTCDELAGYEYDCSGCMNCDDDDVGESTLVVDATSYEEWVYIDLAFVDVVSGDDDWDLSAQRYEVALNEDVRAQKIEDVAFDDMSVAPADGYLTDEDSDLDYVLGDWYDYNYVTHVLTPRDHFYVIETAEFEYYKLEFLDYYSDAGVSGFLTLRIAPLDSPED